MTMKPAAAKRVKEALEVLIAVGIPREQQNERSALTLLALADIQPRTPWKSAKTPLRRITEMMDWMRDHYEVRYAPNTRETIRRQTVHQFVQHGLLIENPDEPDRPINIRSGAISFLQKPSNFFKASAQRPSRNSSHSFGRTPLQVRSRLGIGTFPVNPSACRTVPSSNFPQAVRTP